ncbi:hypothetical protein BH23PAT2_BH23PAT2_09050 [soil metagenome]
MSVEVTKATDTDAEGLQATLEEARAFKASRGDSLWGTKAFTSDEVKAIIEAGDTYVAKVDGEVAGSVILTWQDERMWGDETGADGQAGYIHRLVTLGTPFGANTSEKGLLSGRVIKFTRLVAPMRVLTVVMRIPDSVIITKLKVLKRLSAKTFIIPNIPWPFTKKQSKDSNRGSSGLQRTFLCRC